MNTTSLLLQLQHAQKYTHSPLAIARIFWDVEAFLHYLAPHCQHML
jgi:hypothetical protein